MQTTIHYFAHPEEALAYKAGVDSTGDDMLETEHGPGPTEVTIRDHGCDEGSPDRFADHRLQIDAPTFSDTPPEDL